MVLSVLSKSCPRGRCATQKEWSEEQEWGEDGVHCLFIGTLIPLVIGVFPPGAVPGVTKINLRPTPVDFNIHSSTMYHIQYTTAYICHFFAHI